MGILEDSRKEFLALMDKVAPREEREQRYQEIYRELCADTRPTREQLERQVNI